jgi:hypothetical protein
VSAVAFMSRASIQIAPTKQKIKDKSVPRAPPIFLAVIGIEKCKQININIMK